MDNKFGTNVSNKILLNAAISRVTDLTVFKLLRENQLGGGGAGKINHPPPRLELMSWTN